MTPAALAEEVAFLLAQGATRERIAGGLGMRPASITRALQRSGREDVASRWMAAAGYAPCLCGHPRHADVCARVACGCRTYRTAT